VEQLKLIGKSLREGNSKLIRGYVIEALEQGIDHKDILKTMLKVMEEVGDKFKVNEYRSML